MVSRNSSFKITFLDVGFLYILIQFSALFDMPIAMYTGSVVLDEHTKNNGTHKLRKKTNIIVVLIEHTCIFTLALNILCSRETWEDSGRDKPVL